MHVNCAWECLYNRVVERLKWGSMGVVPEAQKVSVVFFPSSFLGCFLDSEMREPYMIFLRPLSPLMFWRLALSEGKVLVSTPLTPAVNTCWCSILKGRCPWLGQSGSVGPAEAPLCSGHWGQLNLPAWGWTWVSLQVLTLDLSFVNIVVLKNKKTNPVPPISVHSCFLPCPCPLAELRF